MEDTPTFAGAFDTIMEKEFIMPSKEAYKDFTVTIGGVGKHIRWKTIIPQVHHKKVSADLLVSKIFDMEHFMKIAESLKPFAFVKQYRQIVGGEYIVHVELPNKSVIGNAAAMFHAHGYAAIPKEASYEQSCGKLGIERKDRSDHMWWNQRKEEAGPLRDTHRWDYSFIPSTWKRIPFTWQAMSQNINVMNIDLKWIPMPLRNYVVETQYNRSKVEHAILASECDGEGEEWPHLTDAANAKKIEADKLESMIPAKPSVTCRLTADQNIQLLACTYWRTIAPFDDELVHICNLIAFRYCIHGFESREVGAYRQTAQHLGHGAYIRKFKNKSQYEIQNIPQKVLNRVYTEQGLRGSGFKGTRGKYGHQNFPAYRPRRRQERGAEVEERMRKKQKNLFQEYKDDKTQNHLPKSS